MSFEYDPGSELYDTILCKICSSRNGVSKSKHATHISSYQNVFELSQGQHTIRFFDHVSKRSIFQTVKACFRRDVSCLDFFATTMFYNMWFQNEISTTRSFSVQLQRQIEKLAQ